MRSLNSRVISYLRFPLCVAVVLIHININTKDCESPLLFNNISYLFSQILPRVAVPLFFVFSGFLFFSKQDQFSLSDYREKLLKRVRTLLVPYLFWNVLLIIYSLLVPYLGLGRQNEDSNDIMYFIKAFWNNSYPNIIFDNGISSLPIAVQFWYVRDLMVTCLLSPLLYLFVRRLKGYFVAMLGILWVSNCWFLITGLNITALFFFSLGAYCSIYRKNFAEILKPHTLTLGFVYLLFIVLLLILKDPYWNPLRRIGVLIGMAFTISATAKLISKDNCRMNKFLTESSFFIFAYHMLALNIIESIVSVSFCFDILCTILYFAKATFILLIGLVLYYILKKYLPVFTSLITGGR